MSLRVPFVAVAVAAATLLLATGLAASATAKVPEQDTLFLRQAHQGNLAEIAAGTAAQEKAEADVVRAIGADLIADHTRLDAALKQTARALRVSLPSRPSANQRAAHKRLAALSGAAFDQAWTQAMIEGHRMALQLGERELREGTSAKAKEIASSSTPVIQGHLDRLLEAQKTLGAPRAVPAGDGGRAGAGTMRQQGLGAGVLAAGLALALTGIVVWRRARVRQR
ncbi:DUF4142 domain-containing protein [Nonomuraea sp. NPDC003727]